MRTDGDDDVEEGDEQVGQEQKKDVEADEEPKDEQEEEEDEDDDDEDEEGEEEVMVPMADMLNAAYERDNVSLTRPPDQRNRTFPDSRIGSEWFWTKADLGG